jgi:Uma2 family endonuclease
MSARLKPKYTLEEYFELERRSDARYEYFDGQAFEMNGVSKEHARIEMNISIYLGAGLRQAGCQLFPANIRIKVPSLPPYRYSDLSALCGEAQFEEIGGVDVLINPSVIIEVLSSSTESYDRGDKFTHYKSIPSFREYLLVAQHRPHITQFSKQTEDTWLQREFNSLEDVVHLSSMDYKLELSHVYQDLTFSSETITLVGE